jgi:predicted GIY-YIG superfamily endonuclease
MARRRPQLRASLREKPRAKSEEAHHHYVYVVELDPKVAEHPSVRRLNPGRDPVKPCVYVGMTGLDPVERFENHKRGHKSAWTVRKYGIRLLPEMYECFNPMPFHAAAEMEQGLAEDLRAQGYTVTGGK